MKYAVQIFVRAVYRRVIRTFYLPPEKAYEFRPH